MLRPKAAKRAHARRSYREKKEPSPKPRKARPLGKGTLVAQAWLQRTPTDPKLTLRAFAALHGIKEKTLGSALYYIRYPEKKNAKRKSARASSSPAPV